MANPINIATKGKGFSALYKRGTTITKRYSLTVSKMKKALDLFSRILKAYECGASFAITSVVLNRNSELIVKYLDQNIELVVHGYTHIDYSRLAPQEQLIHLHLAREIFSVAGIKATGFRSPYLRREPHLYNAIAATGFSYVSNQPIWWDVLNVSDLKPTAREKYERAIEFYSPWQAVRRPSLPQLRNSLVEIPVSLPDDEILIDRLGDEYHGVVEQVWTSIFSESHKRGELFTLQLHPERVKECQEGLSVILAKARELSSSVWVARLDEIANWWRDRTAATVNINEMKDNTFQVTVAGPPGTTLLARNIDVSEPTETWADGYRKVDRLTCRLQSEHRPFIGVSPSSSVDLRNFLRQQGYLVEVNDKRHLYSIYFDQLDFAPDDEYHLLNAIEKNTKPLVRLARWPYGTRSALSITGDIDALTLWDYGLRLFGK